MRLVSPGRSSRGQRSGYRSLGLPSHLRLRVGAALLLLVYGCGTGSDDAAISGHIEAVLLADRFTVGRLARQRAWLPCPTVDSLSLIPRSRCGQTPEPGTRRFERIAAAADEVRQRLRSDSSAAALHARALLDLRWRDAAPAGLDRAIASLERARRLKPDDAVLLNDLAAAYLAIAERDQQLRPMLQALDAIERALARDDTLVPALFNRALILEQLYLVQTARQAWSRYLTVERHPSWRAEAEAHLRNLEQRTVMDAEPWAEGPDAMFGGRDHVPWAELSARVKHSPQGAREFSFALFRAWGMAIDRGDVTAAASFLTAAREIARALDALDADRSVSFAIRSIDGVGDDSTRLRALARAHVEFADGLALYSQAAYEDAAESLAQAERTLRALGSPMARWARFYRAASYVNCGDYAIADALLRQVLAEATPGEPALIGKSIWALGVSQGRRGNYESANRMYRNAAPHVARAKEAENEGAVSYLLAEGLSLAGQSAAAYAAAFHGLRLLSPFRRSNFLNNHLTTVAAFARADGLTNAALTVLGEQLEVARALDRPDVLALALCARARDRIAVGQLTAARADLAEAMAWADRLTPGRGRDRIRADVTFALGQLMRSDDPRAALPLLSNVVETYRRLNTDWLLPAALYEVALAARDVGDTARARGRLEQAVEQIERQQTSFETAEVRATFYETVENVFDAMIGTELASMRPASAFQYLERGRIAPWPAGERETASIRVQAARASLTEVGARLPPDMLFIEYAVLQDQIVVWTVSSRGWQHRTVPVSRDSLAALVDRFTREAALVRTGATGARALLFDLLIRPLGRELRGVRQLAIVPDRELNGLPFTALWDRETGRYLVESYEMRSVPSAAFFIAARSRARQTTVGLTALVIGDPAISGAAAYELASLPGATREAERIAPLYSRAELLRGADAHFGNLLGLLPRHTVIHFAGHAVFNSEQPELSYLALAPGGRARDGILHAREIGRLRLTNLRMVVLSACSTLNPRPSRTGPIAGLAYSFLRAGAPATISTLWDVSDETTTDLLVQFHRNFASGAPAAAALRSAQLQAVRSARGELRAPQTWAALIYTGP